jgi:hypothetical protein
MEYDEAFGLLDKLVQERYDTDVFEFLSAYSDGLAEELFPDCEDLLDLAEALDSEDVEFVEMEDYV